MDPATAIALYGGGAAVSALGSYFGGQSQADAIARANSQNAQLTREAWARDDTAVERRVADLQRSGLNPALAAGSAASTSSPLQMQPEGASGVGAAMQSAGASAQAWPTIEQTLKRSAAATQQAQAQAELSTQQARIARHDATMIEKDRDPRNRGVIDQLLSGMPKLIKAVKDWTPSVSESIHGSPQEIKRADALASEAVRIMRNNPTAAQVKRAKELNRQADEIRQGGYRR